MYKHDPTQHMNIQLAAKYTIITDTITHVKQINPLMKKLFMHLAWFNIWQILIYAFIKINLCLIPYKEESIYKKIKLICLVDIN